MTKMTLAIAEDCVRRVKQRAKEMDVKMSIAVVDDAGKLVAYARMGESSGDFTEKVAIAKAKTAVAFKRETRKTMERFTNYAGNYFNVGMAGLYPGEYWAGPGGIPIFLDGQLIGGVGVSGSTAADDEKCITGALENFSPELK